MLPSSRFWIFRSSGKSGCMGVANVTFGQIITLSPIWTSHTSKQVKLKMCIRDSKLPLSFCGKRDLADLTSTIMADCEVLEKDCSHFIPGLFGSLISTVLIALSLSLIHIFFHDHLD